MTGSDGAAPEVSGGTLDKTSLCPLSEFGSHGVLTKIVWVDFFQPLLELFLVESLI